MIKPLISLELAFESSAAILRLAGFEENEETKELKQRIIAGELSIDEAVQIALERARVAQSP
jgi:hypothetical protein